MQLETVCNTWVISVVVSQQLPNLLTGVRFLDGLPHVRLGVRIPV